MAQTETTGTQVSQQKKSGKKGFVIFIIIVLLILVAGGVIYYLYKTQVKTGEILNGSYTGENCALTLNVDEQFYSLTIDGKQESGVFDNVILDKKKSSDELSAVYFTADFDGNGTYEVTIELLPIKKDNQLILSSKELDKAYTMTKDK